MTGIIHWCDLCNKRPADGVLTVLEDGQTQTSLVQACQTCVDKIDESDWINNAF